MKWPKKILMAGLMLGMSVFSAHAAPEPKTIKLGTMGWEDLLPITGVVEKVLEDEGYKVKVTEFSDLGVAYEALSRGDVQVMVSQTIYTAQDYWSRFDSRLERISVASYGLYQDLAVPNYVNIDSIDQLNDHAKELNGQIIGIESGSGLMQQAAQAVTQYGLKLKLVDGSTAAMTAALDSAVSRKEPIVVTIWDPSWMFLKYHMKFLKDPKNVFAAPDEYNIIATKGFSAKYPRATDLMAGIFLPISDIRAINEEVNNGMTMDQAINNWISSHGDLMKRWENIGR